MRRAFAPKLKDQEIVPYFKLPSNKETWVSPWDFKQKSNLVIFFFHSIDCPNCRRILTQFAAIYPQYQSMDTEVLAISITSVMGAREIAEELNLPFPVLADDTGAVSEQYTYVDAATRTPVPAIFVIDRYGALYTQSISENEASLPTQEEIVDWLHLIDLQCPECGVNEWSEIGRDWKGTT